MLGTVGLNGLVSWFCLVGSVYFPRNRGMLLRLYSGFSDRIRAPLLKVESFYGMLQMHETDDQEDALEKARRFMSCSPCCAEPIFVLPMQANAREAAREAKVAHEAANVAQPLVAQPEFPDSFTTKQFLLGEEMGEIMTWCGNTPPLLCISSLETFHAMTSNRLKAKGFARAGPLSIIQDQTLTHWKRTMPKRILAEVTKLKEQHAKVKQVKLKKSQYRKPHSMIGQVNAEVKQAMVALKRQRKNVIRLYTPEVQGTRNHGPTPVILILNR